MSVDQTGNNRFLLQIDFIVCLKIGIVLKIVADRDNPVFPDRHRVYRKAIGLRINNAIVHYILSLQISLL